MAFIYEINGQRVEFEQEPTERDIDEAARSLRPAPKSAQPKPVEGQGGAAFGVYRPAGRRPEPQQDREASKEMVPQTARGVVTGTLGLPSDLLNIPGQVYGMATGQPSPYTVPLGSEQWNQMLPGRIDTPQANLARGVGQMFAPLPTAGALKTIPKAVGAASDVVQGAVGTGTGYIARPGRTPQGYQVASQRNPIGSTYTPPEEFAKFERGELPYGQMPEQRPISELPQGKLDRAAMMLSGGNIPNAGKGATAFGERLGETYRNPLTAAADIGSMFFTGGVPVLTTLRGGLAGAQALADMRLASKGFTPELPKILNEYQTGVRPMPGVQPGPMPRDFQAAGPVSPGGMAAPTPAAQAAMATTQAKANPQPRAPAAPRPQAQPFVLPDAGTHYSMAEQGSTNFADTFNKAVAARQADLLKNARQTGQQLTPEQAGNLADEEIRAYRRSNVDAFKPAPQAEAAGPVAPVADDATAQFNPPKVDPELEMDQRIWKMLQDKTQQGKELLPNEQTAVNRITKKYGQDPFQTGNIKSEAVFETTEPTKKRDMSVGNAKKQFYKDLEDDSIPVAESMKKYEGVTARKQMRVYNEAYDAAIAEGKTDAQATQAAKQALQRNALPPLSGERSSSRIKPKESDIMETQMAQAWFDDTIKNAPDKTTKDMYNEMLAQRNGDVAQLYRDLSAQQAGKTTGKSFFEEPVEQADAGKYNTMPKTTTKTPFEEYEKTHKEYGGEWDYKNKTVTQVGDEMDSSDPMLDRAFAKDIIEALPKDVKWAKTVEQWNPEGTDVLSEIWYSAPSKKSPLFKYEKDLSTFKKSEDAIGIDKLYKLENNEWKLIAESTEEPIINLPKVKSKSNPAKTKPSNDLFEMMTGGKVFDNKADFEAQALVDKLAGKITTGSFVDNGMRYEITAIDYGNTPRKVLEGLNKPLTQVRVFSEKTNKQISGPAAEVPEKSLRERVEEKMKKRK